MFVSPEKGSLLGNHCGEGGLFPVISFLFPKMLLPYPIISWFEKHFVPVELIGENETVRDFIFKKEWNVAVEKIERMICRKFSAKEKFELTEIIRKI